ncbi:MAG: PAS domain S-box protein, partial [Candidatus Cloacimonadota bacterium]|nr:PAS domain S-box protein [Candidatus Cloacimonadota bacterium]
EYIQSGTQVLNNNERQAMRFIIENAMLLKNKFHKSTGLFQKYNDKDINKLAIFNLIMIFFALFITIKGLFSSKDIRIQEEQLINSEKNYRTMIESSGDAIVVLQDEKVVFVNETATKMFGYSEEEMMAIEYSKILSNESLQILQQRFDNQKNDKEVESIFELYVIKKDGSKINAEVNEKSIFFNNKKSLFRTIRDITKQKEMLKILQKGAEQTKGLKGFIPICANCYLIRDDEKEGKPWVKPADYIRERLPDIKFTHSICPDCVKKYYGDLDIDFDNI